MESAAGAGALQNLAVVRRAGTGKQRGLSQAAAGATANWAGGTIQAAGETSACCGLGQSALRKAGATANWAHDWKLEDGRKRPQDHGTTDNRTTLIQHAGSISVH